MESYWGGQGKTVFRSFSKVNKVAMNETALG